MKIEYALSEDNNLIPARSEIDAVGMKIEGALSEDNNLIPARSEIDAVGMKIEGASLHIWTGMLIDI